LKIDDDIVKELYDQKITTHVSDLRCWKWFFRFLRKEKLETKDFLHKKQV
jgi:hypothetical protein